MNRFLKHWRRSACDEAFRARVVNYADDFVILSRGRAAAALEWTDRVMTRLGLTLIQTKTPPCDARKEQFDFLGYSFGVHVFRQTGRRYLGASPSKKSVQRLKDKVGAMLVPGNVGRWEEVRKGLNRLLHGWGAYFSPGSHYAADRGIEAHVYDRGGGETAAGGIGRAAGRNQRRKESNRGPPPRRELRLSGVRLPTSA
jgi:RNA-directed DNA polymerase